MNMINCIGNTPLINIDNIYIKLEFMNPSGSIKDRIAKQMILPYIGQIHKHFTVVEATSGNTGISIAMLCAALKLKCWIICPYDTSILKLKLMQLYGAKIKKKKTIQNCIDEAKQMIKNKQADIFLNQFENLNNIEAQIKMATEIANEIYPDAIITGIGTGGTLMGLHKIFPKADIYEIQVNDKPIEGITDNVKQLLIPINLIRNKVLVTYEQAKDTADMLAKEYGIACGISSGANFFVANVLKNKYEIILTIFPDNRIRYLGD